MSPAGPVGFVGLGAMGAPLVQAIADAGHGLVVHDRDPRRRRAGRRARCRRRARRARRRRRCRDRLREPADAGRRARGCMRRGRTAPRAGRSGCTSTSRRPAPSSRARSPRRSPPGVSTCSTHLSAVVSRGRPHGRWRSWLRVTSGSSNACGRCSTRSGEACSTSARSRDRARPSSS